MIFQFPEYRQFLHSVVLDFSTILANWGVLQFDGIDRIAELSGNWGVSIFNRSIKLFSLLILSHKLAMAKSVDSADMCEIELFTGGTVLTWLGSGVPCESSVHCSD